MIDIEYEKLEIDYDTNLATDPLFVNVICGSNLNPKKQTMRIILSPNAMILRFYNGDELTGTICRSYEEWFREG